jgi:hypothetical protein
MQKSLLLVFVGLSSPANFAFASLVSNRVSYKRLVVVLAKQKVGRLFTTMSCS